MRHTDITTEWTELGAVLGVKLKSGRMDFKRRDAVMKYNEYLKEIPELILPVEMQYARHVYHLYVVQTPQSRTSEFSE